MIKHLKQIECFKDPSRFKFILAGRRGGKTRLIVEDIVKTINKAPYLSEIFYIGPTNQDAKDLIWEPLDQRMLELKWKFYPKISRQRFELSKGRKIYVIGAEKIRRVRGHKLIKAYLDELAYFSTPLKEVWQAVRPALADLRGGAITATTPNGKGSDAYEFYLETLEKENWKYFYWKTIDNPYIDPLEIEEAKKELDEKSFIQEYEAGWQSYEGLAYYNFDENMHIEKQPPIDTNKPVYMCLDFNVNPTTLLLRQTDKDVFRYTKEYSFKNASTEETLRAFCEDHKDLSGRMNIKIRGDASGKSRSSNTGKSDYHYVEEMLKYFKFNYQMEVPASNPPIIDRVKYFNGYLKPLVGNAKISIDPSCKELIKDLSGQELNGRIPSDNNNRGHKADAAGYDIYYQVMIDKRKPQGTVIL